MMLGAADDGDVAVNDAAVLDGVDGGRRHIDDDIFVVEGKVEPAKRLALEASCLKRTLAGTFIAFSVAPATTPVCRSPMRDWKRFTAAVSAGSHARPSPARQQGRPRSQGACVGYDRRALRARA